MKKGLVVEIKEEYFIAMEPSGQYERLVKKEGIEIGQKIFFSEEDIYQVRTNKGVLIPLWTKVGTLVAAILLIFAPTLLNRAALTEYAVVSLDINPSIEFILDDKEKVIKVIELNKDASRLELGKLKGKNFEEALKSLEQELKAKDYLKPKAGLLVGMSIPEDEQGKAYEKHVKETIKTNFNNVKILYIKGTEQDKQTAKQKNISLGRYEVSKQLYRESDDEWMKEADINQMIRHIVNNPNIDIDEIGEYVEDYLDEIEDKEDKLNKENNRPDKKDKFNKKDEDEDDDEDDDEVKETISHTTSTNSSANASNKDKYTTNNSSQKEENKSHGSSHKKDEDDDKDDDDDDNDDNIEDKDKNKDKNKDKDKDKDKDKNKDKDKDKDKNKDKDKDDDDKKEYLDKEKHDSDSDNKDNEKDDENSDDDDDDNDDDDDDQDEEDD